MMRPAILFSFFIVLTACQQPQTLSDAERDAVAKEVRAMLNENHNDMRMNGLMAEFRYLDNASEFFWVPPGYSSWLSYDSVKTIITANASAFRSVDYSWDTLRVDPLSQTLAMFTGIVHGSLVDTSGNPFSVKMIESGVAIRRNDGWKLLSGQTNMLPDK